MEPQIHYARTTDGVNIAYYMMGQGPPLLVTWALPSHLQLDWDVPGIRSGIQAAMQRYSFIRYDPRGCGLSDRNVDNFSLDAMVQDMEAVTDRLKVRSVALVARMLYTPVAIAFASRHPDRVSRLALVAGFAKGGDFWSEHLEALVQAAERDWEFATEGAAAANVGWSHAPQQAYFSETGESSRSRASASRCGCMR